jgi:hypothetical protein
MPESWSDIFKLFTYAFTKNALEKRGDKYLTGAGVRSADAIPDIRADGSYWGGGRGVVALRDTKDFLDLSTVVNRSARYKEYERLRNVAEIEMVMNCFADEACIAGESLVATLLYGLKSIQWLEENKKDERFLVYCWDFQKNDYTLGWAFNPRITKEADTIQVVLDDGNYLICTPDHRILKKSGEWIVAGDLKFGDELMPFYNIPANNNLNNSKIAQFPRIFTFSKGWMHERQFVDEWRSGKENPRQQQVNKLGRLLAQELSIKEASKIMKHESHTCLKWARREGFTHKELKWLGKKPQARRVIGIMPHKKITVYDLSVEKHENFCTNWGVVHNCQKGENSQAFDIQVKNQEIKEELEFLFFNRKMLNFNQRRVWNIVKDVCIFGDWFGEVIIDPDNPKDGLLGVMDLPAESIYRIETTKGKLIEFQQAREGPDYQSISRVDVTKATEAELQQATAVRFAPEQVVHVRIGEDRKTFYPYGVSLIEPARGPAHQLRLMEDAMVTYRLVRAPERRVFYIDVHHLPPFKQEAFIERMKDQLRKKKVSSSRTIDSTASSVEERWSAPSAEEDFWIPIRPNSNTRIETLPGAENLGEIDDTVYFRNKLFMALNFPQNYFNQTDTQQTRITLSAQDVKFARLIERIQSYVEDDLLWTLADRHLRLRGFPEEMYEDLILKMTPPSEWRELSRQEIIAARIANITSLKGSQIIADRDLWIKYGHLTPEEAEEIVARNELQKIKDLKIQIIAQNPQLLGVGLPGASEDEIGTDAAGPNPMLGGGMGGPPGAAPPIPDAGMAGAGGPAGATPAAAGMPPAGGAGPSLVSGRGKDDDVTVNFGDPDPEDVKRYDLDIQDYAQEMDIEDIDYSELDA